MTFLFLKNIFNEDDRVLIDCAIRGMHYANRSEVHAGQLDQAYGSFSDSLKRIVTVCYGAKASEELYSRYNFDCVDGDEFLIWFDEIVNQDTKTISHLLTESTIEV